MIFLLLKRKAYFHFERDKVDVSLSLISTYTIVVFSLTLYIPDSHCPDYRQRHTYQFGERDKNQFIKDGVLDMKRVQEKFMVHFHDIYGKDSDKFVEENGRRLFCCI